MLTVSIKKQGFLRSLLFSILSISFLLTLTGVPSHGKDIERGKQAPDFTLKDLGGKSVSLSALKGKGAVHLFFTAAWCIPCTNEIVKIDNAYEKLKSEGYSVIVIGVKDRQTPERLKEYVQKERMRFPVLYDESGSVAEAYGAQYLPKSFIIDKDGMVREEWTFLPKDFLQIVSDILKE